MRFICFCILLLNFSAFAQADLIAKEYFKNGAFEKALSSYQRLYDNSPSNINYIFGLVATHQQLQQYTEAQAVLERTLTSIKYPAFYVELGYNFQLQNKKTEAENQYNKAISSIDENPNYVFSVAKQFHEHSLLEYAITAYEKAMNLNENLNFNMQLAQIYGEQGDIEKMFVSYVDFLERNPIYVNDLKRAFSEFIDEDANNPNNAILRKTLLKKIQQDPQILWNELLSWLFIQQKEYVKAFQQEKAIYTRQPESLMRMEELAEIAANDSDLPSAETIYNFIIENTQDADTLLRAHNQLLQLNITVATPKDYKGIHDHFLKLFDTYGLYTQTLSLQKAYAHFLAFNESQPAQAEAFLKDTLKLKLNDNQIAEVKLELADILVLQEKFNEALILYTQIQRNLKNSTIAQEARFRVAKTSYYKGDFKWAESQLNILKQSTSQLIANDALELKLVISDNKYEDSTQTALKLYAKGDLLAYQHKTTEAIAVLNNILQNHGTEPIAEQTLYKQARLFETQKAFDKAVNNYLLLIANHKNGLLADDAYFNLAQLYQKHYHEPEKAKPLYEQIIFNYPNSIYFVEARNQFRILRGDDLSN